ncbi:hypothetical protein X801_09538, partial [Opisthorchis viverrini]
QLLTTAVDYTRQTPAASPTSPRSHAEISFQSSDLSPFLASNCHFRVYRGEAQHRSPSVSTKQRAFDSIHRMPNYRVRNGVLTRLGDSEI